MQNKNQELPYFISLKERIRNTEIDRFIEYLFPSNFLDETKIITISGNSGKSKFIGKKENFVEKLNEIKEYKDVSIPIGETGESLYVNITKEGEIHIQIRISYHHPGNEFGTGKLTKNTIAFLCIDIMNSSDENKVYEIRKEKYPGKLHTSGLKDKAEHKRIVEENENGLPNFKYENVGTEDYEKIKNTIKSFLKSSSIIVYENLNNNNIDNFDVYYETEIDEL